MPTLETIAFIFYGNSIMGKIELQRYFNDNHIFRTKNIIYLSVDDSLDSFLFSTVSLSPEFIEFISFGNPYKPNYSSNFPASILKTNLNWEDLVLDEGIIDEIYTINTWLKHKNEIKRNSFLSKNINNGYKVLFYGPPGTGKTLTASLLGKMNNLDIYRIDLSQIVSKYIGETEKNLSKIFDIAENKNWILFFDEAESLFSKRTSVGDSKDKFANQQTAYLLQRVENYNGLIILATNLKPNIDSAFSRRIQSVIFYNLPNKSERLKLWTNSLKSLSNISNQDLIKISKYYDLSGGSIKNIIQHAWLLSKQNETQLDINHIILGIKREMNKEGKIFDKSN
jgi:SpoVK/Ycf46/Vps4 family AAA+-type ATPase